MVMLLIVIVTITFKFTYSKFIQRQETNSLSKVAKFVLEVNSENDEIIKEELGKEEELEYNFRVQNFSDKISSEVKSKYNIILEVSQQDAPLKIELYKVNNDNEELLELENYSTKNPEIFDISREYQDYKVKVRFDETRTSELSQDFNIKMRVKDIQEEG